MHEIRLKNSNQWKSKQYQLASCQFKFSNIKDNNLISFVIKLSHFFQKTFLQILEFLINIPENILQISLQSCLKTSIN